MNRQLYSFGPFELDLEEQVLRREGQPLALKPKIFDLLAVLVENSGRVVSRGELMKQVWAGTFVEEGNLTVSIVKLRQALGEAHNERRYIETVPRRGYRFVACVTQTQIEEKAVVANPVRVSPTSEDAVSVDKGTIAILPFKFIGTTDDEYLGLGLADALITRLSNLRQVTVRPTSSIRNYTGGQHPVSVGKELRVEWVLDGSLQKSDQQLRLTVQLLNVADGVLRWGEKFDEKFTDIFGMEDSISGRVASTLAVKLTGDEKRLLAKRYTENTKAYEAYLKGRYFFEKRTTEGCKKGIEYFQQALALDPKYALAYAGMSDCYIILSTISPSQDCNSNAERAALSALNLDTELAEAHASLGYIRTRQWDWRGAEAEFKTSLKLNPNYSTAHAWYALYLGLLGRSHEGLAQIQRAQELDPISLIINSQIGSLLYLDGRYAEAVERFRKTLEMDTDFAVTHFALGCAYEALGEYEAALREYKHSQGGLRNLAEFTACVGRIHAFCGRSDDALKAVDELKQLSDSQYVQPTLIAILYAALEDNDQAFEWLERAFIERDEDLSLLKVDPRLRGLKTDPRFGSLLQRLGLLESFHASLSE